MSTAHAFPTCCGITIVAGFDNRTSTSKLSKAAEEALEADVKNRISASQGVGCLMIALNKHQVDSGYGKVLAKLKFLRMGRYFYHPGHGNNIQVYGYYYHPDRIVEHPDKKVAEKAEASVTQRSAASNTKAGTVKKALMKKSLKRVFG